MTDTFPSLNANSLSLIRLLPTKLFPPDQIKGPEGGPEDEIFLSKYSAFLKGKAPLHETRISLSRIRRGFWMRTGSTWSLAGDFSKSENLSYAVDLIRMGTRPILHLYENPNPDDTVPYVCADDTVMHAAYEKLKIEKVPVALMAKPRNLEESCLSVRCFPRGHKTAVQLLDSIVTVTSKLAPSILGTSRPSSMFDCLDQLLIALRKTKSSIKAFHRPGAVTLHYHHTLYSVLLRAEDSIDSIRLLITAGKSLTAAGLLRSLYELALVFYVDWLAPSGTFRYLQMASVMSEKSWEAKCEEWRKADIADGASVTEAKNIKDAHLRAFRLGCIVGEKARLFPLGEFFQRDIYSFLSDVIHHDFSMTARYTHTLDHGDEAIYHEDVSKTIIHIADLLVASMVSRIRDDIGILPMELASNS